MALPEPHIRFQGLVYRALNPFYARDPLSGDGAALHGGRFNPRGIPALYTALTIMGAVAEANQIGRPFEPITLVSYDCDQSPIFDATDPSHLEGQGVGAEVLAAEDWRIEMARFGISRGQGEAMRLASDGYAGMIVPSFARGVAPGSLNLVLWRWSGLSIIDNENRLK